MFSINQFRFIEISNFFQLSEIQDVTQIVSLKIARHFSIKRGGLNILSSTMLYCEATVNNVNGIGVTSYNLEKFNKLHLIAFLRLQPVGQKSF